MSAVPKNIPAFTVVPPAAGEDSVTALLSESRLLDAEKAPQWVQAQRAAAAEVFRLPTPTTEGWQYTNLRGLTERSYKYSLRQPMVPAQSLPMPLMPDAWRAVVINGQLQSELSRLPSGVSVTPLMNAVEIFQEQLTTLGDLAQNPFVALNAAYMRDGFVLQVARGVTVDRPVDVVFYNTGDGVAFYPRVVYSLGENAAVTIIERHMGQGDYLSVPYILAEVHQNARLKHYRFCAESAFATHIGNFVARLHKNAHFEGFSLSTGGLVTRQDYRLQLIDSGIHASVGGVYMMRGRQGHDFTVCADHFEPHGSSVQHFKGVVDDQARAVFQGKIHVHRPAQKTDGYQSHHALLLSREAEASTKPQLEIYADDVKCTHGATSGFLDQNALFYLQSRGIPKDQARALLVESFLAETLERLTDAPVKAIYASRIHDWLAKKS
jgi:Fe-S cluster assembly protein SufD